ncbi:hypothetical protein ACIA59_03440 [Micromonospora haikouensis]|uniref:hypothetical protein n=1 Tax=Micromonospora haikouensis TaxID=686309 RepID=UPI00378D53EB
MGRPARSLLLTVLLGAVLLGSVGVATGLPGRLVAEARKGRPPAASVSVGPLPGATLPIADWEPTLDQYQRIQRARLLATRRCMARLGIDLPMPPVRPVRHPGATGAVHALGDRDPARFGYRGPEGYQDDVFTAMVRGLTKALVVPEPFIGAFDGSVDTFRGAPVPSGGCEGEVRRLLDTPAGVALRASIRDERVVPWTAFAELEQAATARVESDDRFRRVQADWSRCMRRAGHRYADTAAAEGDGRWATSVSVTDEEPERPVSAQEIATAVADDRCRTEVGLKALSFALLADYQGELIRRDGARLKQVRRLLDLQVASAAAILGEPGAQR